MYLPDRRLQSRLRTAGGNELEQINRAPAQIWLACQTLGPHMSVLVLNDALREALDELQNQDVP